MDGGLDLIVKKTLGISNQGLVLQHGGEILPMHVQSLGIGPNTSKMEIKKKNKIKTLTIISHHQSASIISRGCLKARNYQYFYFFLVSFIFIGDISRTSVFELMMPTVSCSDNKILILQMCGDIWEHFLPF